MRNVRGETDLTVPQSRPRIFEPGTPIGQHLRVESCIRVCWDRVLYYVNNADPRWNTTKCWVCGNKGSPPNAQACTFCHAPLGFRRMIMTSRFRPGRFDAYKAYLNRRVIFNTLEPPVAVYRYHDQMLAFFLWNDDTLLALQSSPLPSHTVLATAFDLAVGLSHLHDHGVVLAGISPMNLLFSADGRARLFDLEIEDVSRDPISPSDDPTRPPMRDIRQLAALLDDYVSVEDEELRGFFRRARRGGFRTADAFAGGIAQFARMRTRIAPRNNAAAQTDAGIERSLNEDSWGWRTISDRVSVYVVADGMGGHEHGDAASQLAVRTLLRTVAKSPDIADAEQNITKAFAAANKAVRSTSMSGAGTTLVAMVMGGGKAIVANVGDSRAYLLRDGHMNPITEDHSMVAAMVATGKIKPEDAWNHPKANVLLHYVGATSGIEPDLFTIKTRPGDRLLLCSDGLWGEVQDRYLTLILDTERDPRNCVHRLIEAAMEAGGRDNITAIVVDIP